MSSSDRSYHHGNLRAELIAAALDMLDTQSAAGLSLRKVAQQAGVSHNAPYHHFADRTTMLEAVGVEAMSRFVAVQREAAEHAANPRDALLDMGVAYVGWASAHPGAFAVIFDPEICSPGDPSEQMGPLIRENELLLHAVARAAAAYAADADPAAVPTDPGDPGAGLEIGAGGNDAPTAESPMAPLEVALWGMVHGLAVLHIAGHFPEEAVRPALEASLAGLGI